MNKRWGISIEPFMHLNRMISLISWLLFRRWCTCSWSLEVYVRGFVSCEVVVAFEVSGQARHLLFSLLPQNVEIRVFLVFIKECVLRHLSDVLLVTVLSSELVRQRLFALFVSIFCWSCWRRDLLVLLDRDWYEWRLSSQIYVLLDLQYLAPLILMPYQLRCLLHC